MTLFFGPYTSFRFKILLPPVLVLLFLLCLLSILGNSWLRDVTRNLAQSTAETRALEVITSPPFADALKEPEDKGIEPMLSRLVEADPKILFAVARLHNKTYVGTRTAATQLKQTLYSESLEDAATQAVLYPLLGADFVIARKQLPAGLTGGEPGDLFVGSPVPQKSAEYKNGLWLLVGLLSAALIAYVLAGIFMLSSMGRRMEKLVDVAHRIEHGDLQARIGSLMPEELAIVGRAFDGATERLQQAVAHIGSAARTVERTAGDVGEAKSTLQRGINTQVRDVDDALQSVRDIMQALTGIVKQVEGTRDEMRQASGITQRLTNSVQEATGNVEEAERAVALAGESIQQVASSTSDVAKHADTLSDTTASTASAMLQMKHSITRVRETAITAASLAEQAGMDAERGTQMLTESMTGIEHIREASRAIGQVTEDLERRVGEIGDVLHLITELTQRTNLLALNASIIAAQAGAEGRGFAVVADEIKDLARRTANSAGSIDNLIQAVAEGAHAARRAALAGSDAVETGATQAQEAARTMTDILSRLRNSAAMAKSIATATEEQARSSAYVTRSIQEVQGHVNEIGSKAVEQARRGEYLQRQVGRMRELIEVLSRVSREQREGMVQVSDTLLRVLRALEDMANSQRSRMAEGERVRGMLEVLRRVVTSHRDQIVAFDRAVSDLNTQAAHLRTELTRVA